MGWRQGSHGFLIDDPTVPEGMILPVGAPVPGIAPAGSPSLWRQPGPIYAKPVKAIPRPRARAARSVYGPGKFAARPVYGRRAGLGSTVMAGAVLKYSANIASGGGFSLDWSFPTLNPVGITPSPIPSSGALQGAVSSGVGGNGSVSQFSYLPQSDYEGSLIAVINSTIQRGSEQDLKGDIDSSLSSLVSIRSSNIAFVSNPAGGPTVGVGSMLPGGDQYHAGDTILGTAAQFWAGGIGGQLKNLADGIVKGGPMVWLGVGVVALILLRR